MIPLYKPYMPDELPCLEEILHSGALAYGKWGRSFEDALQKYLHCLQVPVTVNSFTAAIHVMLAALGVKRGDEIIASPQSCLASTMPLLSYGAKVVWADVDPKRGTLCPESVEGKISPATKAIFHNHHCGYPGYIDEINEIGRRKGLFVIDDCIEAFGAHYKGKLLGTLEADATLLSFQTVRLPNTIDGGSVIFRCKEHVQKAIRIRDLGVDRSTFRDAAGEINPNSDVSFPGYGVTMNEVASYIGCLQVGQLDELLEKQRQNAFDWQVVLSDKMPGLCFLDTENINPNYWVFGILAKDKAATLKDFKARGYSCSGVHLPNSYYSVFGEQGVYPGVREFHSHFVALPCGWWFKRCGNE